MDVDHLTIFWIVLASGVGTYLIRLAPMLWQEKGGKRGTRPGPLRYALDAIGPAAIVALLTTSFWSMVSPDRLLGDAAPIVVGLAGVVVGKHWLGTIAWATLMGVAAYGLALWAGSVSL
jgi:uncharacterized membrane protein